MRVIFIIVYVVLCKIALSQTSELAKGNRYYHDSNFTNAALQYKKSILKKPTVAAHYNLGNTLYNQQNNTEAIVQFDAAIKVATDAVHKAQALYNKGVILHRNNQLVEAIEAYKQALRLTPEDDVIRKNLQLALEMLRRQQSETQQKEKKQEPPPQQEKKQEPPPPPKLSKKQAEQLLQSLNQKERQLQEKMQKKKPVPAQMEKDW